MKFFNKLISIFFIFLLINNSFAEEQFYPTTISSMNAEVRMHGTGSISQLKEGETVELTLLTFQESDFQQAEVITEKLYINEEVIHPTYILDEFDNKYVKFEIPYNGDFEYEIIADITTNSIINEIENHEIGNYPENLNIYLDRTENVEATSSEIQTVAFNKFRKNDFVSNLNEVVFWVNDYVEYARDEDFQRYYLLQKSAIDTLLDKKGVCDEFANLATGILRAKGIPTRLAIGITYDGLEWGNHAWIEVYNKEQGWIPSDPTFREAGFVDATHIKIASFKDVSLSVAKAVYPGSAKVNFQTQTIPEVTIKEKEFFNIIDINPLDNEIKTNQWNELDVEITNLSNLTITAPLNIRQNYSQIFINNSSRAVTLGPGESEIIRFNVYPMIDLDSTQVAQGTFTFNSLSEPYDLNFTIVSDSSENNGNVYVKDITPVLLGEKLILKIEVVNELDQSTTINIDLNNSENNYEWDEELDAFETKLIRKEVDLVNEKQLITINTESQIVSQEVIPILVSSNDVTEEVSDSVIIQKIPEREKETTTQALSSRPYVLLFAALIGIAVLLLGLFAVKQRYV
jgi:hypothetical protein